MSPTSGESLPEIPRPPERTWSPWRRFLWWAKAIGIMAGMMVSVAAAARVLGVTVDIETKTESAAQHEEIKRELRDDQNRALGRVEKAIEHLGDRIDQTIERSVMMSDEPRRGHR